MRLGIPDFKLSKALIDRRAEQMKQEGVTFVLNTFVGKEGDLPRESTATPRGESILPRS